MPFTGKIGDTIRLRDKEGGHRWVIIGKPNRKGFVVIVNFTSAKYWKDPTTKFSKRDDKHLFHKDTYVRYSDAKIVTKAMLIFEACKKEKKYLYCKEVLLKKIIKGVFESEYTPGEIIDELKTQYPNEYKKYYKEID